MMRAAVVSAAKPCTGCILTILWPKVRMMRQPPAAVPAAMVSAQATTTHLSTANSGVRRKASHSGRSLKAPDLVPVNSASAMIPMVFCASLEPWLYPMKEALTSWSLPNTPLTVRGRSR